MRSRTPCTCDDCRRRRPSWREFLATPGTWAALILILGIWWTLTAATFLTGA